MTERKKVTLESLIKKKMELKGERKFTTDLFIPSLDADITIEAFKSDGLDFIDATKKVKTEEEAQKAAVNFIYSIVKEPDLSDKELQKEFECVEPTDVVEYIFTDGEQEDILSIALAGVGLSRGTVKEIKN